MFDKYRQLILSLIFGIYGTVALFFFDWPVLSVFLYLAAIFFLYSFFAFGPVFVAFAYAKRDKFESASKILDLVGSPEKLSSRKAAYYTLTRALIHTNSNELSNAEADLKKALNGSGLLENDEALAYFKLACINHLQGRDEGALALCHTALRYRTTTSLSNDIKILEEQIRRTNEPPRKPISIFSRRQPGQDLEENLD